ncbi:hypothetical protein ACFVUN_06285 [Kitasatospora griseola]|uniref:hypothetical protein n=1 Tax=Kitasatospora griseola TaxID=2064 RepID=UPI0036DC5BA8
MVDTAAGVESPPSATRSAVEVAVVRDDRGHIALPDGAAPVSVAWSATDQRLWFLTTKGLIGATATQQPYQPEVFPWQFATAGAGVLVAWPDHGAWTVQWRDKKPGFVRCLSGAYTPIPADGAGASQCHALALASDGTGKGLRLVAPLSDTNLLAFCTPTDGGNYTVSYSGTSPGGSRLYGVAARSDRSAAAEYWVSSPEGKYLATYAPSTGRFGEPVTLPAGQQPRDIALTPAGDIVWVATAGNALYRFAVKQREFLLPAIALPGAVRALRPAPGGILWFTCQSDDRVGYVLPGAAEPRWIQVGAGSKPAGLTMTDDGTLWAALSGGKALQALPGCLLDGFSGGDQSTAVGEPFPSRLRLKVMALDTAPCPDVEVTFTVKGSAVRFGDAAGDTQTTDADGVATSSELRGVAVGTDSVVAAWDCADATAVFENLKVTGAAAGVDQVQYVSGGGQQAPKFGTFPELMKVKALDKNGAAVSGASVTFTIREQTMAEFPDGHAEATVQTGATGEGVSPKLKAGAVEGPVSIEATAAGAATSVIMKQTVY